MLMEPGLRGGGEQHVQLVDGDLKDLVFLTFHLQSRLAWWSPLGSRRYPPRRAAPIQSLPQLERRPSECRSLCMPLECPQTNGAPPRLVQDEDTVHLLKRARFLSPPLPLCFVFFYCRRTGKRARAKDVRIVLPDLEKNLCRDAVALGSPLQVSRSCNFCREEGDLDGALRKSLSRLEVILTQAGRVGPRCRRKGP